MTYDLYIDVVFLVNFVMDYLLLVILRKILKLPGKSLRLIISSGLGALWACLTIVFPVLPLWLEGLITYFGVSSLMVIIAFKMREVRQIGKAVAGLYLTTVMVSGLGYFLYEHTKTGYNSVLYFYGVQGKKMPVFIFLLLIAGSYFGIRFVWNIILGERRQNENLYSVILHYRGRTQSLTALLDTGNRLREPVSQRPVNVVTYQACREICERVSNLLFIPYQAVGTKQGMLPAVKFDEMEILDGEHKVIIKEPLIAIAAEPLSADGRYQMLLHAEMLEHK